MILFTIGTSEPFDRLVEVADAVAARFGEPVLVQGGRGACRPHAAELVDFLPFDELRARIRSASRVVTHAGAGSVLLALGEGKRPVVVPRLRRYGEAIDDHQLAFARRLDSLGLVRLAAEPSQVIAALALGNGEAEREPSSEMLPLALALRRHLEAALPARDDPRRA